MIKGDYNLKHFHRVANGRQTRKLIKSLAFWKSCWPIVGREVMQLFEEFHMQNSLTHSLNATFLVFIPKKGGAGDVKDFRPISLLGSLYKLLAKVLANRLKRVIGKVVSNSQNAFVGGRQRYYFDCK